MDRAHLNQALSRDADQSRLDRIDDLRDEYEIADQIEEEYTRQTKRRKRRIIVTGVIILLLVAAVLLVVLLQTYDSVQVLKSRSLSDAGSNGYTAFAGHVLKYNRDGVSLMDTDGEDKWNQATQFKQPAAVTSDTYAVVADIKGTDMYLFDEKGLVKQLSTTKPIEKVTVGHDGTVVVIQENGSTPVVSCYSREGKMLLKHQASLSESGYPISAAVSEDGEVLALSYLRAGSTGASGRISLFAIKSQEKDNTLFTEDLKSQIAGEVFFIDKTVVVVGEKECFLYQGFESPKKKTIDIDGEIEKVFRDGRYFGFVLRMSNGEKSLRVYSRSGSEKLNETVTGNYDKVLMMNKQVLLFSGQECCIYTLRGIHRFDGQMRDGVLYVMPVGGINRYAVITYDGIDTVYLTK